MNIEIERKFLFKAIPNSEIVEKIEINQWYRKNNEGIWERVRSCYSDINGIYFIHTVKTSISPGVNMEDEKSITSDEFNAFVSICKKSKKSRYIFKERFIYKHDKDDLKWEVDVFRNGHHLVVAEIEIPDEKYKLEIPKFIKEKLLIEVTDLKQFSNKNLSNPIQIK